MKKIHKWFSGILVAVGLAIFTASCVVRINPDGTVNIKFHSVDQVITVTGLEDALWQVQGLLRDCLEPRIDPVPHGDPSDRCTSDQILEYRKVQQTILRLKARLNGYDLGGNQTGGDDDWTGAGGR